MKRKILYAALAAIGFCAGARADDDVAEFSLYLSDEIREIEYGKPLTVRVDPAWLGTESCVLVENGRIGPDLRFSGPAAIEWTPSAANDLFDGTIVNLVLKSGANTITALHPFRLRLSADPFAGEFLHRNEAAFFLDLRLKPCIVRTNEVKCIRVDPEWAGAGSTLSFDSAVLADGIDTARYFAWVVPNNSMCEWASKLECGNGEVLSAKFLWRGGAGTVIIIR